MKVIIEQEIENCEDCPFYSYAGESWSESIYECKKIKQLISDKGIDRNCPFIETTINKLQNNGTN